MNRMHALLALAAALPLAAFRQAPAPPAYSLTFPAGWSAIIADGLTEVRHPGGTANCNSYTVTTPGLANMTQAQMNASLTGAWGAAEWADFTGAQPAKVQVVSTTARAVGPYQLRTGVILFRAGSTEGQSVDMYAHLGVILAAGRAYNVGCYALPSEYPGLSSVMAATVNSMRVK